MLQVAIVNYTNVVQVGGSTDEERRKAAASAYDNFFDYLLRNAIFLPKSTAQQLDELRTVYGKSWNKFLHGLSMRTAKRSALLAGRKFRTELRNSALPR